jgi:Rrf2 family protein
MLTQKTKYALKALSHLAVQYGKGPVLIADISKKKRIPLKFLENILLELKKQGLLESKKGKGGGYFLATEPGKIPLAKIMRLVEGPIAMLPCVSLYFYERCKDCNEKDCGMNRVFIQVRDANLKILEKKTLKDLI